MSYSKTISPERVAGIECRLDRFEVCACIFLLYEEVEIALQEIQSEIQSMRRHVSVLDSSLYKEAENYLEGPLSKWAKYCETNCKDHWQDEFLESMMIIKNYSIIKSLGFNESDLQVRFLSHRTDEGKYVNYVRKVLYLMIEDLTVDEWNQLHGFLKAETKVQVCLDGRSEHAECFLLFLMSQKVLKIKTKQNKMDFGILRSCLEMMGKKAWVHELKSLENLVNEEFEGRQNEQKITAVPRYDLDSECPGTILIFNLEDYNAKQWRPGGQPIKRREGSHIDRDRLKDTFNLLGFKVIIKNNPSSYSIKRELNQNLQLFCSEAKRSKTGERCFVVAILAHGDQDGILGIDGEKVEWDFIRKTLRSPETVGLPRLLIIQACKGVAQVIRENRPLTIETDGVSDSAAETGNLKDLWELSASVDGFAAYRSVQLGSFFILSLCKKIIHYGQDLDLDKLTTLINRELDEKEIKDDKGNFRDMITPLQKTSLKCLYLSIPERKAIEGEKLVKNWEAQEREACTPRNPYLDLKNELLQRKKS